MMRIMRKSLLVLLSVCVLGFALVSWWPGQSDSVRALSMAREACGLEKSKGKWDFSKEKDPTNIDFKELFPGRRQAALDITTNLALLAQRAALLDSKWIPLADGLSMFRIHQTWLLNNLNLDSEYLFLTIEGRVRANTICNAIRVDGNS
jgi:hypothetical protein